MRSREREREKCVKNVCALPLCMCDKVSVFCEKNEIFECDCIAITCVSEGMDICMKQLSW